MQTEAGHAGAISSDVDARTNLNGKYGTAQTLAAMSSKPSGLQWNIASKAGCVACGQPLEEWEVDVCEGCGASNVL
jgi:hypothetical protein